MTAPIQVSPSLSDVELVVLHVMSQGGTYDAAARQLGYHHQSTVNIGSRVIQKLGARSMPHAVLLACRAGLLDGRPQRHGDHAGFAAHRYRGEDPCEACWEGEREYRADLRRARKTARRAAA